MYFKYGSYRHANNEVNLQVRQQAIYERGRKTKTKHVYTLQGRLRGDSPEELTDAINELVTAYSVNGRDAGMYFDDGTRTSHVIRNSDTLEGVKITELQFPDGSGAEYTTHRTYQITLEAELLNASGSNAVLDFTETLTFSGGGPKIVFLQTLVGPPVKQIVAQQRPYRIIQAGSILMATGYANPAPPMFPTALIDAQPAKRSPKNANGRFSEFMTSWQYTFESATALNGNPNQL